jgi:hypothetical protein
MPPDLTPQAGTIHDIELGPCQAWHAGDTILFVSERRSFSVQGSSGVHLPGLDVIDDAGGKATYEKAWVTKLTTTGTVNLSVKVGNQTKAYPVDPVGALCTAPAGSVDGNCLTAAATAFSELQGRIITDPPHQKLQALCDKVLSGGSPNALVVPSGAAWALAAVGLVLSVAWLAGRVRRRFFREV